MYIFDRHRVSDATCISSLCTITEQLEKLLSFPSATPIANSTLDATFIKNAFGKTAISTYESHVIWTQALDRTEIVSAIAYIDNPLILAICMPLLECIKLVTCSYIV